MMDSLFRLLCAHPLLGVAVGTGYFVAERALPRAMFELGFGAGLGFAAVFTLLL